MATDVFGELRQQIRSAALDHKADPSDRVARLTALRTPLADCLGELDRYRGDQQQVREASAGEVAEEIAWARANADVRRVLVEAGELTEDRADDLGLISHAELDRLQEEGLLEAAVLSLAKHWEEELHPRGSGGEFSNKFGAKPVKKLVGGPEAPHPKGAFHLPDTRGRTASAAGAVGGAGGKAERDAQAAEHEAQAQAQHDETSLRALADYVASKSEAAERTATPALHEAVTGEGGELQGLDNRLKSRASIISKLRRKRDTMPLATDEERAQSITDGVRYSAVFDTGSYTQGVERSLGALEDRGFKIAESENYWGGDDDYDALHIGLTAPNGARIELQFHTKESIATKKQKNHPLYERFRESNDPHERWDLWNKMVANTQSIPQPKGVEELGTLTSKPASKRPVDPNAAPARPFTNAHQEAAAVLDKHGAPGSKSGDAQRVEDEAGKLHQRLSASAGQGDQEDAATLARVLPADVG